MLTRRPLVEHRVLGRCAVPTRARLRESQRAPRHASAFSPSPISRLVWAIAGHVRGWLEFLTELTMVGQVMVATTSPARTGIGLATPMGRTARTACSTDLWRALLIGAPPLPLF